MIPVTTLINLLDKPALKYWANKQGLKGIDINKFEKKVQTKGNIKHDEIEQFIKNGTLFNGVDRFEESIKGFQILACEESVDNGFINGRVDLVLTKNNLSYVVDFKSNKNIYLNTKLQLSSYKHIIGADYVCFMDLEDYSLKVLDIDTNKYFEIVKRLYQIKVSLNELNENL